MEPSEDLVAFCKSQHPVLVGVLTLYCGDRDLAGELTQETLARACLHWNKLKRADSPEAWTHRVAINLANSFFRRKAVERRARQRMTVQTGHSDPVDPEDVELQQAVRRLPDRQRAVIALRYYADLSVRSVAEITGLPEGTVKTLTRRALASLRASTELQIEEEVDAT